MRVPPLPPYVRLTDGRACSSIVSFRIGPWQLGGLVMTAGRAGSVASARIHLVQRGRRRRGFSRDRLFNLLACLLA